MAAAGEGHDGGKSGLRCLDAARYVASAVVIVLIAAVVINAIRVVLRPDDISVSVVGSSVITRVIPPAADKDLLSFEFTLRAVNPSGRVRIYFYDITAYLFENSTLVSTPTPKPDCSIFFPTPNMTMPPTMYVDNTRLVNVSDDPATIVPSFFHALYRPGGTVSGATMRVDGSLVSETRLGFNTSTQQISLYCRDVVVGPEDKVATSSQGTTACTK